MYTELAHLPPAYIHELELVVHILRHEFSVKIMRATKLDNQSGRILKIILFGSFANRSWVDDPDSGYKSDYDLLIVVNKSQFTNLINYWEIAEERIIAHQDIQRDVQFIVHSHAEVNEHLQKGQYFFQDIINQGITLYQSSWRPFAHPKQLSPETAYAEARKYAEYWLTAAGNRIRSAEWFLQQGAWRDCIFDLHQTVERAYHGLLLTHTFHTPASHNIKHLRSLAEQAEPKLVKVWPRQLQRDRTCFELLKRAYVESRYSMSYQVNHTQLIWLIEHTKHLIAETRTSCATRLKTLLEQCQPANQSESPALAVAEPETIFKKDGLDSPPKKK